jgi:hypothetical protein
MNSIAAAVGVLLGETLSEAGRSKRITLVCEVMGHPGRPAATCSMFA